MTAHRRRRPCPADEHGRDEHRRPVHETRLDERPIQLAAPFQEDTRHVHGEQARAEIDQVHPAVAALAGEHGDTPRFEGRDPLDGRLIGHRDDSPGGAAGVDEPRIERKPRPAVHHHAQWLARPGGIEAPKGWPRRSRRLGRNPARTK